MTEPGRFEEDRVFYGDDVEVVRGFYKGVQGIAMKKNYSNGTYEIWDAKENIKVFKYEVLTGDCEPLKKEE